jgi:hypothetical protein
MAYLPGVPNVGPAPVGPSLPVASHVDVGSHTGIAKTATTVGKPGNTQHLGSVVGRTGKGLTAVGGGNPMNHSMNAYGKNGLPAPATNGASVGGESMGGVSPTAHKGAQIIRGGGGGVRAHVKEGGLGPGKMGMPGPSDSFTDPSQDTE